ncbi:hypothetical protein PRK78_002987 [Emydomyces testavorans]|uniref:CENP-T/Histone H4 histone fold domain-containing protein n=1 Tax=Emydomyces testavorans TaxID=2070801 RepID=A0AAF0IH16_9EURO|nr:hypothetical protein PRK78_002987 [Emydomyces testavorans]
MASPNRQDYQGLTPQSRRRHGSAGPGPSPGPNTPYNAELAGIVGNPATPAGRPRRSLSTGRVSVRRSSRGLTGAGISDTGVGGSHVPATPHALRAFQRRAAAYTPGRDRRKSGRVHRETPLDILRNLGKALAPTSEIIKSSPTNEPEETPEREKSDDLDQEPDMPKPRLSLPMNEMIVAGDDDDDGSPEIAPPRLSLLLDEDDFTQRSIEMPRRERTARDLTTLSRHSLASTRFSEHFGDESRMEDTEEGLEFTAPQDVNFVDDQIDITAEQPLFDAGGETEDLRRFELDFSFPTPDAPPHIENDFEDFVLDTTMPIADNASVSSLDEFGAEGLEPAMPEVPPTIVSQESPEVELSEAAQQAQRKQKLSRHGIPVPKLPRGVLKKLATRFARTGSGGRTRISKETLVAIEQATDWFFEQASDDLTAYSKHSNRKTIDETDVVALMRRQRQVGKGASVFALAQKHLPKELLQDIRLPKK